MPLPLTIGTGRALLSRAAAAAAATYILNEQFTTDQAAPLTSPRNAEPGPGVGTIVDTETKFSISGSVLVDAGGKTVNAWNDPAINWAQTIFPVNRVFDASVRLRSAASYDSRIGFRSGASLFCDSSFWSTFQNGLIFGPNIPAASQNVWYQVRIISAAERYSMFIKGGAFTSWQLMAVLKKAESPNLFPAFTALKFIGDLDTLAIYDTTGWGELGAYTGYSASGAAITGSADGFAEVTWTAQAGETLDLAIRQSDATHRLIVRCSQAGSTVKLMQDNAGETELTTAAQTFTANTTYTILVLLNGTTVRAFVGTNSGNSSAYTQKVNTTSSFNQTQTSFNVSGGAWVKDLLSWPMTYADGFVTQAALRSAINLMPYGDSKTADATGFKTDSYPQYLCRAIGASETPTRIAVGGRSTAAAKAAVDAELAAASGTPNYITYNLGANDVSSMPAQATWEANTAYILDAMHAKWPSAHIYLARVWVRGKASECTTLATWRANVLATRSAWAHNGPDESVYLENGDDGTRYTSDGTHPRIQEGYILTAAMWKIALGL